MSRLKGFTLIEVAIFLVITGALFVAVTVGVQNSIYQQRYNDAVQGFVDFLKNVYSETTNTENTPGSGRSEKAIYGKLVTFGEANPVASPDDYNENTIYAYNVVGDINEDSVIGSGNALGILANLKADVAFKQGETVETYGIIESYLPRWSSQVENTNNYDLFKGALLIVRHPSSGTVYTFALKGQTIDVRKAIQDIKNSQSYPESGILTGRLKDFAIETVDFCLNPEGDQPYTSRRDIRITANARNASGISAVSSDTDDNICNKISE